MSKTFEVTLPDGTIDLRYPLEYDFDLLEVVVNPAEELLILEDCVFHEGAD